MKDKKSVRTANEIQISIVTSNENIVFKNGGSAEFHAFNLTNDILESLSPNQALSIAKANGVMAGELFIVDSIEDIHIVGENIFVFDGCEWHIDYVDVCPGTGEYYMANKTAPKCFMVMPSTADVKRSYEIMGLEFKE